MFSLGLFSKNKKSLEDRHNDNTTKWIMIEETKTRKTKDGKEISYKSRSYKCQKCHYGSVIKTKYCPDCGRRAE